MVCPHCGAFFTARRPDSTEENWPVLWCPASPPHPVRVVRVRMELAGTRCNLDLVEPHGVLRRHQPFTRSDGPLCAVRHELMGMFLVHANGWVYRPSDGPARPCVWDARAVRPEREGISLRLLPRALQVFFQYHSPAFFDRQAVVVDPALEMTF